MTYSIEALSESNSCQWENFNKRSGEGTLFHSVRWKKILEDEFALKLNHFLFRDDEKVIGIYPSIEQSAGYFKGLNVLPYSEFNNLILDDSFDVGRINDLLSLFSERYSFLHLTTYAPAVVHHIQFDNYPVDVPGHMMLDLKKNPPDVIWSTILSKDQRQKIRAFEKDGFEIHEADTDRDIERFYHYYKKNMVHINGEILPISFFRRLRESSPEDSVRLSVLTKGDVFAGGGLTLTWPEQKAVYFEYLSLNRALPNRYTPSLAVAWEGIRWAGENGYETVSFGRQKWEPNSPRFRNKARFGAEFIPILSRLVVLSKTASLLYRIKRSAHSYGTKIAPSNWPSPAGPPHAASVAEKRGGA